MVQSSKFSLDENDVKCFGHESGLCNFVIFLDLKEIRLEKFVKAFSLQQPVV